LAQQRKDHHPADTLDELASIGERLVQWVGANPVIVLGMAGAILLAAAGYGGYRAWSFSQANRGSAALATLHADFVGAMGGKVTDVDVPEPANPETAKTVRTEYADKYLALAKEWSGSPTGALALLQAGQLFDKLGNRDRALEVFQQAASEAPAASPIRGVLDSRIGHLLEEKGDFAAAAASHEAAAAVPGFPLREDALADAARCYAEAGKNDQALAIYQRLKSESPDLKLLPHVEARLSELEARNFSAPAAAAPAATIGAPAAPAAAPAAESKPEAAPAAKP
jgi:tetratricopeptide (TPR) repeat protein